MADSHEEDVIKQRTDLSRKAFDAYGDLPGLHGPWKTFDGRPMPKWDDLNTDAGVLTQNRWGAAVKAVLDAARPYLMAGQAPPGWRWDPLSQQFMQLGPKTGPAINRIGIGA